tara:strand:+ start:33 stop:350 length:318 start_codon:yes stop_codon:yes gene_type:complete
MNMDVTNKELQRLLKSYLKRLDKMDKDRDQMMKKLKALSDIVKHMNSDLDELFKVMDVSQISINFEDSPIEDAQIENLSILIDKNKGDFNDEEYLSLIHSVVGEA